MIRRDDPYADLDARITASTPSRPYPRSVKHQGRWQDGRVLPVVAIDHEGTRAHAQFTLAETGTLKPGDKIDITLHGTFGNPVDEIRAHDRRWWAWAVLAAAILAAGILLWLTVPAHAKPCPSGTTSAQCRWLHTPQDLRNPSAP